MSRSSTHPFVLRACSATRPPISGIACEPLEPRRLLSAFNFNTGNPDGRIATIGEPPNPHNSNVEFESADDFILDHQTVIKHASFTGLLTGAATLEDVSNVFITIYRVFPKDSDTMRVPQVPTRMNSPSDNEIENRDSAAGELNFHTHVLSTNFSAQASVSAANKISVGSGGNGTVSGTEVEFDVVFRDTLDLAPDHYFFVPKVGLNDDAPASAHFLWLSAPKPIVPPGTPFLPDLQSWMRDDPGLAPDWLRIGADIIGGSPAPAFNGTFSLKGHLRPSHDNVLDGASAPLSDSIGVSNEQPLFGTTGISALAGSESSAPSFTQRILDGVQDVQGLDSDLFSSGADA